MSRLCGMGLRIAVGACPCRSGSPQRQESDMDNESMVDLAKLNDRGPPKGEIRSTMDSAQLINLLMLAATIVQTVLAIRSQNQNGVRGASSFAYDKKFVISKKRAYWLLATVVVMVTSSVWAYVSSRTGFKHLPDNELTRITGQQFVDETVVLDGKDFENCTFSGVTLKYDATL
jgi:hypothetical protein